MTRDANPRPAAPPVTTTDLPTLPGRNPHDG